MTVSTGGATTFNGVVGGTPLISLTTIGGGTTEIKANVTTSGIQTYSDAVTLLGNITLTGTTPTFSTVAGGGFDLTLSFSDTTAIVGGNFTGIKNLTSNNGGNTSLSGNLTTTGTQTYTDDVVLTGTPILLTSTGAGAAGNIKFDGKLDGAAALTVTTGGTTTFNGVVGGGVGTALASLTTNGGGATVIKANVTTSGIQTYTDDVVLASATILLTSTGTGAAGNIKFDGKLDGAAALTVATTSTTTFNGVVGMPGRVWPA